MNVLDQRPEVDAVKSVDRLLPTSSAESARMLAETREALRQFETSTLSDVAYTLSVISESLAQTTQELASVRWEEWLDAEGARLHLKRTKKQFERLAPRLPRHYVSERGILYNARELDEWLMER